MPEIAGMDDVSDRQLGELLRSYVSTIASNLAERVGAHGVTLAEAMVMRDLYDAGAVAPSTLADRLGMTRGAITKLVDRLRAKRFVVRAASGSADRRYQTIALTGAGARLVPLLADTLDAGERAGFAALDSAERAALSRILRKLAGD